MTVSERIKRIVDQEEGGNVSAAARRLGCSSSGLQKIYAGETTHPRSDLLVSLVREYGVDPEWLLLGEEACSTDRESTLVRAEAVKLLRRILDELR